MIVRAPLPMEMPPDSYLAAGDRERIISIPEHLFRPRQTFVIEVSATAIGATQVAGPRFRIQQIMLPSSAGYRFAIGVVVDDDEEQRKIAKTYPIHGSALSEMSPPMPFGFYVKDRLEIYVKRCAIHKSHRFLGEPKKKDREQIDINTTRPEVKEPSTVKFVGSVRLLLAPPNGWN